MRGVTTGNACFLAGGVSGGVTVQGQVGSESWSEFTRLQGRRNKKDASLQRQVEQGVLLDLSGS